MNNCYIGVDIGKTNMRFGLTENGPELKFYTKRTYTRESPDEFYQKIFEGIVSANKNLGENPGY
jgi:predicted NBD/HSP70 family sugar kinase